MSASRDAHEDEVRMWLRYAREDADVAQVIAAAPHLSARSACWHAQQAAEKALKAALSAAGQDVPRTHNLVALRAQLKTDVANALDITELAELTAWAVESRYPGDWDEPTADDAHRAASIAVRVLGTIDEAIRGSTT